MEPPGRSGGDGDILRSILYAILALASVVAGEGVRVTIEGSPPLPDPAALGMESVQVSDSSITELQETVLSWYLYTGYPFASAGCYFRTPDTLSVRVVPGRHALLEEVRFEPEPATHPDILLRFLRMSPGEVYSSQAVEDWKSRLNRLDFIEWAGETHLALGQMGNMVVIQEIREAPMGFFSASMGFSGSNTGRNTEGGGEVVITNLLGTGRQLELSAWSTGWGGIDASLRYREPWIAGSPLSLELRACQQIPESAWVNREAELVFIWELETMEILGGAGIWKGYQPDSVDRSYRYGIGGIHLLAGKRLSQGWQGVETLLESRIGETSGPDSAYVLASADLDLRADWFRGALGLGCGLLAGGVLEGEWVDGRLKSVGGIETLRGYPENSYRTGLYLIGRPEISVGETPTRGYLFADICALDIRDGVRYPVGIGAGLRGRAGVLQMDVGVGFPVLEGLGRARFYLKALASII